MTNVSRIVALGCSIHRILRVSGAPGGPDSNVAKRCSALLRNRVGPLKEPCSRVFGGSETLEARSDERLEDRGPGRLHLSYSTSLGGSWELQIPRG